jgi:tetratricopeptide (TPR) repeat protein
MPPPTAAERLTATNPDEAAYRSRLRLAGEYQREKRWEEALELYREILEGHPESTTARRNLKQCLLELKQYDELQRLLEDERSRWGEQPGILEELGIVAARRGDRDEAAAIWRRILELQGRSRSAYSHVAELMQRHRLLDEALAIYEEAEARYPGRFLRAQASLHEQRFEFDQATLAYLRFLDFSPTALSYVEGRLLRIGENEESLRPVIDRTAAWIAAREAAADSAGAASDGAAPDPRVRPPHIVFRKLLGDLYLEAGDHEKAMEHYFRLVDQDPAQHSSLLVFGKRCQADGEHEVAIRVFERIVDEIDDARAAPTALAEIATSHAALGEWDEALAGWERLAAEYPETNFALGARFEAGRVLREGKHDPAAAEKIFRELIAIGPGPWREADPQFEVAECAVWNGDLETAAGIYRAIRERRFSDDTKERSLYEEGRIRFYLGEHVTADSLFKEVPQRFPKGLHVNDALEFSILINTNPDPGEVLGRYADALYRLRIDRPEDAVPILEEIDRSDEFLAIRDETLLLLGRALRRAGHPERALSVLERAVAEAQVMDLAAEARFLRGSILAEDLRDPAGALAEYEELLVSYPETLAADRARDLSGHLTRTLP